MTASNNSTELAHEFGETPCPLCQEGIKQLNRARLLGERKQALDEAISLFCWHQHEAREKLRAAIDESNKKERALFKKVGALLQPDVYRDCIFPSAFFLKEEGEIMQLLEETLPSSPL